MPAVVHPHCIDAHDLRNYLDAFIRQNECSHDVEHRWLASYAADLMARAYDVKIGNHDTIRTMVEAFRMTEIEAARANLAEQDKVLGQEMTRLMEGRSD